MSLLLDNADCVYGMRMARVNVYLPDNLATEAKAAGLNVSSLTQEALRSALTVDRVDEWLDAMVSMTPLRVDPVEREFERRGAGKSVGLLRKAEVVCYEKLLRG